MFCSYCDKVILEDEVCPKCGGCADCCTCYGEDDFLEEDSDDTENEW